MKITITGHRPHKLNQEYDLRGPISDGIKDKLTTLFNQHKPEMVYIGMAIGADMIAAFACVETSTPFTAVLPLVGQQLKWPDKTQLLYHVLLVKANLIYIVDTKQHVTYEQFTELKPTYYHPSKMQTRNKWMVDQLTASEDRLIAIWDGSDGGTANCVKYAQSTNKAIITISPEIII